VEGESTGAHAAVMALWLNADQSTGTLIDINTALLRFPMIKHYKRYLPNEELAPYFMGKGDIKRTDLLKQAEAVKSEINLLEKSGLVPTRSRGGMPQYVASAYFLSFSGLWQDILQRQHYPDHNEPIDKSKPPADFGDCLERARNSIHHVYHQKLPPIYKYHGDNDIKCPHQDTEEFRDVL
jgi:hypothetical protein